MIEAWYWRHHARQQKNEYGWFLYLLAAPAGPLGMVVKVGISEIPFSRALALNAGCPFPVHVAAFVGVGNRSNAYRCEQAVLSMMLPFRVHTRGEWMLMPRGPESRRELLKRAARAAIATEANTKRAMRWRLLRRDMMRAAQAAVIHANLTRPNRR